MSSTTETIREDAEFFGTSARVDRAAGIIRGVKVLGLKSANRRAYKGEALRRAVQLYEGARVNVNHKRDLQATREYQERLGILKNVTFREGSGLFANLHYNPKHALAEQLAWDAEHSPGSVGLSPIHTVEAVRGRDGTTVIESIRAVKSVDLVADPATTRTLFESIGEGVDGEHGCSVVDGETFAEAVTGHLLPGSTSAEEFVESITR